MKVLSYNSNEKTVFSNPIIYKSYELNHEKSVSMKIKTHCIYIVIF